MTHAVAVPLGHYTNAIDFPPLNKHSLSFSVQAGRRQFRLDIFASLAFHEPRLIEKFYAIDVNTLIGPCNLLSI